MKSLEDHVRIKQMLHFTMQEKSTAKKATASRFRGFSRPHTEAGRGDGAGGFGGGPFTLPEPVKYHQEAYQPLSALSESQPQPRSVRPLWGAPRHRRPCAGGWRPDSPSNTGWGGGGSSAACLPPGSLLFKTQRTFLL